jgi:hypothetical protein
MCRIGQSNSGVWTAFSCNTIEQIVDAFDGDRISAKESHKTISKPMFVAPVLANATKVALITRFMTAFYEASVFLANPENQRCSIGAIAAQLNVSTDVAASEYALATDPVTGETKWPGANNFMVNRQGLLNVIDLRGQFGGFANNTVRFDFADAILPGVGKFIGYTIRDKAIAAASDYKSKCK